MLTPCPFFITTNLNFYNNRHSPLSTTELDDPCSPLFKNNRSKIFLSNVVIYDQQMGKDDIQVCGEIIMEGEHNVETIITCYKCRHRMPNNCVCRFPLSKPLRPTLSFLFYKSANFVYEEMDNDLRAKYLSEWTFFTRALTCIDLFAELKRKISIFIALLFINDFDWLYETIGHRRTMLFNFPVKDHFSYLYKELE